MSHAFSVVPLRLGLGLLRLVQPGLPGAAGDALRRAAALRLAGGECDAEPPVDAFRQRLKTCHDAVEVVDYGAGAGRPAERIVSDIYRRAATGPAWGRFLFGLVRGVKPTRVLELGTNLGVGAAHLAAALALNEAEGHAGRLVTMEGAPELAARAAGSLARLGHPVGDDGCRVRVVVGPFDETLAGVAREDGPFDLVFVDGHHEAAAALRYLDVLRPHLADGALVVLDDVEPFRPVRQAFARLRGGAPSFYAFKYGLLVHAAPVASGKDLGGAAMADARETASPSPAGAA